MTAAAPTSAHTPQRQLTLFDAVSTMIGIILGSGIFVAPAAVAAVAPGLWQGAAAWLLGGCIALCGAFCYAECAGRMPCDGGFFVYYERAFGPGVARVAGWAAWLITYPASLTAMAWIAANYLHGMLALHITAQHLAALLLIGAALLVAVGVRFGAWLQRVLTTSKVLALLAVALAAAYHVWVRHGVGALPAAPVFDPEALVAAAAMPLPITAGLVLTAFATLMWTFDGWSDITMLAGEIKHPARNLGRAALWGVMIPAVCYALLQMAVSVLLPSGAAMRSDHVLSDALVALGSPHGGVFLGTLAVVSAVGALHGVMSACSRLGWAMGHAGQLPAFFGHLHGRLQTPLRALAVPLLMAVVYLYLNTFADLMGYFAFAIWLYYALTALALLRLRALRVGAPVAWQAPGGVLVPAVVLAVAALMTALQVYERPGRTLIGVCAVAVCALLQWFSQRQGVGDAAEGCQG